MTRRYVGEIPKSNYGVTYAMYDNNCVICLLFCNVNPKVQSVETVSVTRGNLTPTVSAHTTIIPALDFVLCSSVEGTFEACSSAGNKITEGGVIGKVSEEEIKSPVDATILSIISSNESVPKNYPLATAKYTGFALKIF